jgi:hypothetical protein
LPSVNATPHCTVLASQIRISEALIRSVRNVPFENDEKSSEPSYLESLLSSSPDMMDSKIPGLKSLPLTRAPSQTKTTMPTAPSQTGAATTNDDDDELITSTDKENTTTGAGAPTTAAAAATAAGAKKKEATKIVKFTPVESSTPELIAESPFVKERVGAKKAVASRYHQYRYH